MNKTTNYQLNQWERTDKVQMEDFNADNAKIDAAIQAVDAKADGKAAQTALNALTARVAAEEAANPRVKLLDMTIAADTGRIDLDVSQLDLARFQRLELRLVGKASDYCPVYVRLNGIAEGYFQHSGTSAYNGRTELLSFAATANPGGILITLYLFGEQLLAASQNAFWDSSTVYTTDDWLGSIRSNILPVSALRTINFFTRNSGLIKAGTKICLWGIKL